MDNPVYCGKIAYGRRTKEKVKGTKNDYQMKRNDDYILTEGQHKGIVSEEVWEKAHAKRLRTGVKQPSKIGRDRVHLLSGLLKCPVCGSPKIMVNFDCVYNIINDEEKRNVVTALIKEIEIYRNDESEYPLKRIGLNFPVFKDGGEVTELLWDKGNTVETVVLLSREKPN